MLKRIISYKKYKDYYNLEEFEVYFSVFISLVMLGFLIKINFYFDFYIYVDAIKNLFLNLIGGTIALLGFILTGIALIVGLFDNKIENKIDEINETKDSIIRVLTSFEFAVLSLGFEIIILIFIYLLLTTGLKFISVLLFYLTCITIFYFISFNLFYTIGLVHNCVSLFNIFIVYSDIIDNEENLSENR